MTSSLTDGLRVEAREFTEEGVENVIHEISEEVALFRENGGGLVEELEEGGVIVKRMEAEQECAGTLGEGVEVAIPLVELETLLKALLRHYNNYHLRLLCLDSP